MTASDNKWVIKQTKNTEIERLAILPQFVIDKLLALPTEKITELNLGSISNRFAKLLKKSEIPTFRFHDLRHYWVSVAHAMGMPDYYIMKNGGWTNMQTPMKIYNNYMPELVQPQVNAARDKFEQQIQIANEMLTDSQNTNNIKG